MPQFIETQSYGLVFDIIGALVIIAIAIFALKYTDNKKSILACFAPFALLGVYFMMERLDTRIDETGITFRMFPAQWKEQHINWNEVRDIYVANTSYAKPYNDLYALSDSKALFIWLTNGSRVIIGTREPDEAMSAVRVNNVSSAR